MENFLFGLIGAALSGITFLAYKHPEAYEKLFDKLWYASLTVFLGINIWNIAGYHLWGKIEDKLTQSQVVEIEAIFDSAQVSFIWTLFIFFGVMAYLIFLSSLPRLLDKK